MVSSISKEFRVYIYIYIRVRMKSSFKDGIESFGIRFERKKERGMAKEF